MTETIQYKHFDSRVVAFTTKRTLGRDRARLCQMLCIEDSQLVIPHQTHGASILPITEQFLLLGESERKERLEGIDAVITNRPGVCIGVSTADCIPLLLHDEQNNAVAAIHAGWKGTVRRIAQLTLREMARLYGTKATDVKAVIGPGISQRNFEVGDEVWEQFAAAGLIKQPASHAVSQPASPSIAANNREEPSSEAPSIAARMVSPSGTVEKWHLDLWLCNRLQLLEMGVKPENIHTERICTFDNTDQLFSARREQRGAEKCGRNFNAIMLKT